MSQRQMKGSWHKYMGGLAFCLDGLVKDFFAYWTHVLMLNVLNKPFWVKGFRPTIAFQIFYLLRERSMFGSG